jgi:cysteine desulfurase
MNSDKVIYVDNNSTTRVAPEVVEAMLPYLNTWYGNPSSPHAFGEVARKAVEKARGQVAALLGALPEEIIFTGCGTESDNAAILSALENDVKRRKVVTTRWPDPSESQISLGFPTH